MGRAGRTRDRSVDMMVAWLRGRCEGTDSHLRWSMFAFERSMSIRAFVVGCIRVRIHRFPPSYTGRAASACRLSFWNNVSPYFLLRVTEAAARTCCMKKRHGVCQDSALPRDSVPEDMLCMMGGWGQGQIYILFVESR